MSDVPSIVCPRCGMRSYHPKDIEQGYCGHCHDWTSGFIAELDVEMFAAQRRALREVLDGLDVNAPRSRDPELEALLEEEEA